MQPIVIIGGGLAGLALGTGLCRAGVPVNVVEAGSYPRHRTCGEFINGLDAAVTARLGLKEILGDAPRRDRVTWFNRGARPQRWRLPRPALVVSRNALDARLADQFLAAGGTLTTGTTGLREETAPGRVFATGRKPDVQARWLGLKVHVANLPLDGDLEFHVGRQAYVGLCALGDSHVNVCGLFPLNPAVRSRRRTGIGAHLRAAGLGQLADRLDAAAVLPETFCAVAGLRCGFQAARYDSAVVGDAFAVMPPFTGQGMAMAFASAASALAPLLAWARSEAPWSETLGEIRRRQVRLFSRRLRRATGLHPFLLTPAATRVAELAQRCGLVPWRSLSRLLG